MNDDSAKTYEVAVTVTITVHHLSTGRAAEDYAAELTRGAFKRTGYTPDKIAAVAVHCGTPPNKRA